jgi:hypothetical protein
MTTGKDKSPADALVSKPLNTAQIRMIYINGIAGLCMFFSWLAQTVFLNDLTNVRMAVEHNRDFIQSENSQTLQWMLSFQSERRRDKPDPEVLVNSAVGYADKTLRILEAAANVDPDSRILAEHLDTFKKIRAQLDSAVEQRNIQNIVDAASSMMEYVATIAPKAETQFNSRVDDLRSTEETYRRSFQVLFVIGSVVSAYAWQSTYRSTRKRARA